MKARKVSPATQIRKLKKEIADRDLTISVLRQQARESEVRLMEARRRTIPMRDGSELNFLPLYIASVKIHRDVKEVYSAAGHPSQFVTGKAEVTILAEGEIVQFAPPAAKPMET